MQIGLFWIKSQGVSECFLKNLDFTTSQIILSNYLATPSKIKP